MSTVTEETERKGSVKERLDLKGKLAIREKLDLDDLVGDVALPSTKLEEYIRVLKLARKPSREEFTMIAKVSLAGIGVIGAIGFIIYALLTELPRAI
ncbi:MAG: protein translocase SEC61 complex subunit gamma [Methanothrix sp.]|nr:protein translocase SEC61 complex subunit gamma [Methanothrix sp.]